MVHNPLVGDLFPGGILAVYLHDLIPGHYPKFFTGPARNRCNNQYGIVQKLKCDPNPVKTTFQGFVHLFSF